VTEQPTTPPEPSRPMPRLGRGIIWPDIVAEIDRDQRARQRATEPAASPEVAKEEVPQVEPTPTPSLGEDGSSLGDRLPPPDVAPWGALHLGGQYLPSNPMPQPGQGQQLTAGCPPMPPAEYGPGAFDLPPGPTELRALADELNAHGGVDETFVAALLEQVVADTPVPLVTETKPVSFAEVVEAIENLGPMPAPIEQVKLTREQIAFLPKAPPRKPWEPDPAFGGVPVELVETVEESTPFQLANPGGGSEGGDAAVVEHHHIWTITSPVRCVECRRYLRPWWRRALDRARRWGR